MLGCVSLIKFVSNCTTPLTPHAATLPLKCVKIDMNRSSITPKRGSRLYFIYRVKPEDILNQFRRHKIRILIKISAVAVIFWSAHCVAYGASSCAFIISKMIRRCKASEPWGRRKHDTDSRPARTVEVAVSPAFWNNSPCSTWMSAWFLQA